MLELTVLPLYFFMVESMFTVDTTDSSSNDTSWSAGSSSENGHNVSIILWCFFAHHDCSPLLQGNLYE